MTSTPDVRRLPLLALFAGFVGLSVWLASAGLPIARGDDAFYKAPGAELAATGTFASPSVTGYLPKVEEVFAAYPPLYPWAFAGWVKLFGFSLVSATAFNHAIHLLATAALMGAVVVLLRPLELSANLKTVLVGCVAVVHFGNLRFFDRQEDLALAFVWLESTVAFRSAKVRRSPGAGGKEDRTFAERKATVASGLCIGLAMMVGPWPGMLAAGSVGLRLILEAADERRIPWLRWMAIVVIAALPLGAWLAWLEFHHTGLAAGQFREHVSRVPTVFAWEQPAEWARNWTYAPNQLPFVVLGALLLRNAMKRPSSPAGLPADGGYVEQARRRTWFAALTTTTTAIIGIVAAACWRADSYVYLWTALAFLFPYFGFAAAVAMEKANSTLERRLLLIMVTAAAFVALRDPVTLAVNAVQFPPKDRHAAVFARLHERIPASEIVATTPRFWHAFQNRNPWRQTSSLGWITEAEWRTWKWVVLPVGYGGERFRAKLLGGFELVDKQETSFNPWQPTFPPDERNWAFELYRRR
jgi:hypothetical protein